ncbi:antA/AntB antirepressor family protein [Flavobacterium columnare]|uniref:antA/AntB antirepressor family protein n=1 Tax=Flavobacterium columnare TaxID=996 RepID=UPI0013CFBE90|nr:antA/AntB antirepressor family protein [Flavobacterium columnare]
MNQLINITNQNGTSVVSARDLHQFLESKQEFATWIKNRIQEYGFVEDVDYTSFDEFIKREIGGTKRKEYAITLDMAKELSMVEKTDKGREARRYFIAVEKKALAPQLSATPSVSVIEERNKKRDELLLLIRNNLLQGDIKQVAISNDWSYEMVRNVVKRKHFNSKIVEALFNKAMSNKQNQNIEITEMINQLKYQ